MFITLICHQKKLATELPIFFKEQKLDRKQIMISHRKRLWYTEFIEESQLVMVYFLNGTEETIKKTLFNFSYDPDGHENK